MACFVSTKIRHHRRRGMYIKTKTRHQWSQILVIKPQLHLQWGHILKLVSCFFNHYKTRPDWWRVPNEDVFCSGRNLTALTINMSLSHHVKRLQSEHDEHIALSLKYTFLFIIFLFFKKKFFFV